MRPSSLARRLFFTATAITVIVLTGMGLVLSTVYRESVERAFDRRLNLYLRTIVVDVATAAQDEMPNPAPLGEPLFELPYSGWYWQIVRMSGDQREARSSASVPDEGLGSLEDQGVPLREDGFREGYLDGPEGQRLRVVENLIDLGEDGQYLVTVAGDALEIDEEAADFNEALLLIFGVLGIVFVATAWFQVRFGLKPLARISESLAAIRTGRAERLEGQFPEEVAPLARELNALIESNREIVERARTHVGNLAHALKTPLSVLLNETSARTDTVGEKVREQVDIMREQVQHHLERARLAARVAMPGSVVAVAPAVSGIVRTMKKMHHERALAIETRAVDEVRFHGEQQDLEEMIGNLIDNACKWAAERVEVELVAERRAEPGGRAYFRVIIDDDGPGLAPDARTAVLTRGGRLDESKPGSGLGLSIVVDLAALYGGKLDLGNAPTGGLRAELVLPAAEA